MSARARSYFFLCSFLTGSWTFVRDPLCLALFLGSFALTYLLPFRETPPVKPMMNRPTGANFFYGIVPVIPLLAQWLLGRPLEFPISGDHSHHVFTLYELTMAALPVFAMPLVALVVADGVSRKHNDHFIQPVLLAVLLLGGFWMGTSLILARYPAGAYFLAVPLEILGQMAPGTPLAAVNAFSWIAYLWILRPVFLGLWPDYRSLFACGAWLAQYEFLYYSTSTYLEPWSCVLILLALEMCARGGAARNRALYVAGAAACFKDQAIFALPLVWLLSAGGRPWNAPRAHHLKAAIAASPFIVFMAFRRSYPNLRPLELPGLEQVMGAPALLSEYGSRIYLQLGTLGAIAVFIFIGWLTLRSFRPFSWPPVLCLLTVASMEGFFLSDKVGQGWAGYPRYRLLSWIILTGAGLFLIYSGPKRERESIWVLGILFLAFLPRTAVALYEHYREGDYALNFAEHYDSPVYFPIRQLANGLALKGKKRVVVIDPIPEDRLHFAMINGYPDLFEKFDFDYLKPEITPLLCSCGMSGSYDGVMLLGVLKDYGMGFKAEFQGPDQGMLESCASRLESTCQKFVSVRTKGGKLWGALGLN